MTDESPVTVTKPKRKWLKRLLIACVVAVIACGVYVRTHPLVFNESFFSHAHCIAGLGASFHIYAEANNGKFPTHTHGYGDALLLLAKDDNLYSYALTGPGYDPLVFDHALTNQTDVLEADCGRVYVQGISEASNPEIAILFDKIPTPGGDHCHLFRRLTAPLCREILLVDGMHRTIPESKWPDFAKNQIELLVKEGFSRAAAEQLYAEKGKVR